MARIHTKREEKWEKDTEEKIDKLVQQVAAQKKSLILLGCVDFVLLSILITLVLKLL